MDFGELTLDGLVDPEALFSAIPEADLRKIRLQAPQSNIKVGPAPNFQIMVANGQLETSKSIFRNLHGHGKTHQSTNWPLIPSKQKYYFGHETGCPQFPLFLNAIEAVDHKYTNVMEPICIREDVTIPTYDRQLIQMASQLY